MGYIGFRLGSNPRHPLLGGAHNIVVVRIALFNSWFFASSRDVQKPSNPSADKSWSGLLV